MIQGTKMSWKTRTHEATQEGTTMSNKPRMEMGVVDGSGVFHPHSSGDLSSAIAAAALNAAKDGPCKLAARDRVTGKVVTHGTFRPSSNTLRRGA